MLISNLSSKYLGIIEYKSKYSTGAGFFKGNQIKVNNIFF